MKKCRSQDGRRRKEIKELVSLVDLSKEAAGDDFFLERGEERERSPSCH